MNSSFSPIWVRVPATSANLGPGFDCLGVALSLFNRLSLRPANADSLRAGGEGERELHGQNSSLAHDAARLVFRRLGVEISGLEITMENAIPFARGLGSSSAAIVAGMRAANEFCAREIGKSLLQNEILGLAARLEGHPDNVAPALLGGAVAATIAEDGQTHAAPLHVKQWPIFVAFVPDAHLATETARGVLPDRYSRADAVFNLSRAALLVAALANGDFAALREALQDRIHQPFRAPLVPGWSALHHAAMENGALGVTLSGAGPTILVWCQSPTGAIETALANAARHAGVAGRVWKLHAVESAHLETPAL